MLDTIDLNILQELELDSRQSQSKIASKLKTNKTQIKYRIDRMTSNGIIKGYSFITNQALLGYLSYGLLIKFSDITIEQENEFIKKIRNIKNISLVAPIIGEWDLLIIALEKNISSFTKTLDEIINLSQNHIKEYEFYIDYEGKIKSREYLYTGNFSKKNIVKYGSEKTLELKDIDLKIYDILKSEPKISLLKIAQKIHKTYDTIKTKYSYLTKIGLLLRCSPKIDIRKIGYQEYICLFNLSPSKKIDEFIEYCMKKLNIVRYSKCLGSFNLIINIHAKDIFELRKILYQIRKEYSEIIINYNIIEIQEKK